MHISRHTDSVEVVVKDQRRRRWSLAEKAALVRRTYEPGMSVSLVARQEGVSAGLLFQWRKLERQGALTAVSAGEAVVPASELAADIPLANGNYTVTLGFFDPTVSAAGGRVFNVAAIGTSVVSNFDVFAQACATTTAAATRFTWRCPVGACSSSSKVWSGMPLFPASL